MDRPKLNFIVDALAFASFALMTATGFLLRVVLEAAQAGEQRPSAALLRP